LSFASEAILSLLLVRLEGHFRRNFLKAIHPAIPDTLMNLFHNFNRRTEIVTTTVTL
jgi:hypothetical protein